jgi:hypothetical protein
MLLGKTAAEGAARKDILAALTALPKTRKPKPRPGGKKKPPAGGKGPAVPLPGWPTRSGLGQPTIWRGKQ